MTDQMFFKGDRVDVHPGRAMGRMPMGGWEPEHILHGTVVGPVQLVTGNIDRELLTVRLDRIDQLEFNHVVRERDAYCRIVDMRKEGESWE